MSMIHKIQFLKGFKDVYYIDYRMFPILLYIYVIFMLTTAFIYHAYRETHRLLIDNKVKTSELLMKIHNKFEIFEYVQTDNMGIIVKARLFDGLGK